MGAYKKISEEIDFNLTKLEDRLELVNNLVGGYEDEVQGKHDSFLTNYYSNHYNPHINQAGFLSENTKVTKDLESLANYILYAKDSEAQEDTITDYRKKRNTSREASIEKMIKVRDFKKETNKSIIKVPKIKVSKKDREQYPELKATGDAISNLTKMIKTKVDSKGDSLTEVEVRRLKWIRTDIQKDEIAVKNELKGYIRFQSITKQEPDRNALSYIRFDDIEIIRILIESYSELRESSYDDTFGYLKIIIFAFEKLIEKTEIQDFMKDVLIWKIENIQYDEMIDMLKEKYDMKMTKPRLSKITRETLPNLIVDTYKQQREDWVYTYVMKGNYITCSECKNNYLATKKYFNTAKSSKTGLRSVCKECRKDKRNLSAEKLLAKSE